MRLLLVEDCPMLLECLRSNIKRLVPGWTIYTAESPHAALNRIRHTPVDVVLADYGLPEMNGGRLLDAIENEFPATHGILLTGEDEAAICRATPGRRILRKPCATRDLINAILNAVNVS